jgi:hypothetical protein
MPSSEYLTAVLNVSQERMHTLKDVFQAGPYFFTEPDYDAVNKKFFEKHSSEMISIMPIMTNANLQSTF